MSNIILCKHVVAFVRFDWMVGVMTLSPKNTEKVMYIDDLWELIREEAQPLRLVIRTDSQVFDDADLHPRVWWCYGRYEWEEPGARERSVLRFDIPDEIYRRIQQEQARRFSTEYLGWSGDIHLPRAFRGLTDDKRTVCEVFGTKETIINDWPTLRRAIELTVGQKPLEGPSQGEIVRVAGWPITSGATVRVENSQLQLCIQSLVADIQRAWKEAVWALFQG